MPSLERRYGLDGQPGGLGLSCTSAGLALAGAPLLRETAEGLAPRPESELGLLLKAAYGREFDPNGLIAGLNTVAQALNGGNLSRAMMAAVHLRLPDLAWDAAARLAQANDALAKYDPDEPRDRRGRWTTGGATGGGRSRPSAGPVKAPPVRAVREPSSPARPTPRASAARSAGSRPPTPAATPVPTNHDAPADPLADAKRRFNDLGPLQFADYVQRTAWDFARQNYRADPQQKLLDQARYAYLVDRLALWIRFPASSTEAHNALLSASMSLYHSAYNSGLVTIGGKVGLPQAYIAAALEAPASNSEASSSRALLDHDPLGFELELPVWLPGHLADLRNSEVGVGWGKGIQRQGFPWEDFITRAIAPLKSRLSPLSKTWDFFCPESGRAISAKTMDILIGRYVADPTQIFRRLKVYVDQAAAYKARPKSAFDVPSSQIKSKEIQLAIPATDSPQLNKQIIRAILYAKSRDVKLYVTRIQ